MRLLKKNILLLIFLLGLFLRVYNIPQTLLFHFDQGYHALAIKDIWDNHRFALLGHKTDVEGIFHGSFFYYLLLPLYLLSSWNPAGVSILLAILDSFSVLVIYLIGKDFFNKKVGLVAALFYAVSYSLISYSRWLSNVTLIPFFSTLFFYFLFKSYQGKIQLFPLACLFIGVIIQLNGAIGFFLLLSLFFVTFFLRKKLWRKWKILFLSLVLFLLPSTPLIIFDFRHNFLVSRSILGMFTGGQVINYPVVVYHHFVLFINEFSSLLTYKIPILGILLLGFVFLIGVTLKTLRMVIGLFFLQILGLVFYPKGIHQFFYIFLLPLAILVIAVVLVHWQKIRILKTVILFLIMVLVVVNLYHWRGFLKPGFNLIPIGTRNLITLDDRLKAADFMYQKANNKPFKILIYIIPYFQEQPWDYIFSWYGKKKYGYLPNLQAEKTFVIYEPDYDFSYRLEDWLGKIGEDHGGVISSFKTHDLTVEERER